MTLQITTLSGTFGIGSNGCFLDTLPLLKYVQVV